MKFGFLLFILILSTTAIAQPGYRLYEELHSYDGSIPRNIYKLRIEKALKKDVLKSLEKRLESGTKKDAVVNNSKITIEKVVYKNFWSDSLVIEAELVAIENGTMCMFSIDLDTLAIGSKAFPELDIKVTKYLRRFGLEMYEDALGNEMHLEQKHLKAIEKEHRSVLHETDKTNSKIKANKVNIELKEDEIDINKGDRQTKLAEMEVQKVVVVNTSKENQEQISLEKSKLKNIKNDYNKLKSEYKKLNNQISKYENEIRDLELKKEKLILEEVSIKDRLNAQNMVVAKVKEKQNEVKVAWKELK